MLSIVVCSVNEERLQRLCQSIDATALHKNELIITKNAANIGLCEVYNQCAAGATTDYLCFVHEDVVFHTPGWDERVIKHLQDDQTGMIGVMGGQYKSRFGTGWNDGEITMHRYNILNGTNNGLPVLYNPNEKSKDEVICLDGAFLCCTRAIWQQHQFDEKLFKGFHFYDLDICLQNYLAGHKNYIVYDVLIEHFSAGTKDRAYLNDYFLFFEKWKNKLPVFLENLSREEITNYEGYALAETIRLLNLNGFSNRVKRRLIRQYFSSHKNFYHLFRLYYFLVFKR